MKQNTKTPDKKTIGKELDVFISYAHDENDQQIAYMLQELLQSAGLDAFIDREIKIGAALRATIQGKVRMARHVVVIFTPTSIDRTWVWAEAGAAMGSGIKDKLKCIVVKMDNSDARLSPVQDYLCAEPNLEDMRKLVKELIGEKDILPNTENKINIFVDICNKVNYELYQNRTRRWCKGRKQVCENIKTLDAIVGELRKSLETASDNLEQSAAVEHACHDLTINKGLHWFGPSESDEYSTHLLEMMRVLHEAKSTWEMVLMGHSLTRFFCKILEGGDERVQHPFRKEFIRAIKKGGMRVKVLLSMPTKIMEVDGRGPCAEGDKYIPVRNKTNLTLQKLAELKIKIGAKHSGRLEVKLTEDPMRISLNWLRKHDSPPENVMLATHYMCGGLHNYSHSVLLKGATSLVTDYQKEFDWYWGDQQGQSKGDKDRTQHSREVIPLLKQKPNGDCFKYVERAKKLQ